MSVGPDDFDFAELETRLAAWKPAADAVADRRDRMLFEAGRASAMASASRRRRWIDRGVGVALAGCLAGLVALGAEVRRERDARRALERSIADLRAGALAPSPHPSDPTPAAPRARLVTSPDSYLAISRRMIRDRDRGRDGVDDGPAAPTTTPLGPAVDPGPPPSTLRVRDFRPPRPL